MTRADVNPARTREGRGLLFIVSSPSGGGKTTLVRRIVSSLPDIRPSVSRTTRPPRPGEKDGEAYHFVTEKAFGRMIERGEFVEWAVVHGRRYGTPRDEIERARRERVDLTLAIDVQGAEQVRRSGVPCVTVFVLPPSARDLRHRLVARGEDDRASIERRLAEARREIRQARCYDYIVVNQVIEDAAEGLRTIIRVERSLAEAHGRS